MNPNFRSAERTTSAVSSLPARSVTIVARRTFMLSAGVFAVTITSMRRPIRSVNSLYESMGLPLKATILSPFLIPAFAAALPGITLSVTAGVSGAMNFGSVLSMPSRFISPGRLILIAFPLRIMSARVASDRSRNMSMPYSLNSPFSVPTTMSPSRNPSSLASLLNFIPWVISFVGI